MNKKILSLLLVLIMALSFVSCSGNSTSTDAQKTEAAGAVEAPDTSETPNTDTEGIEKVSAEGLWADAVYRSDESFGEGAKTIEVEVKADEQSVTFTIKTDKETLGDALLEHKLVEGEQGAYGLYIKKVNGILADYDVDQHYWSLSKNGTALMTGADGEKISGGEHYEITRAK